MRENKNLVFSFSEPEAIIDSKILKAKRELKERVKKEKKRQRKLYQPLKLF